MNQTSSVSPHLLSYVNEGSIAEEELEAHVKVIIDAADKYSIVNLERRISFADFPGNVVKDLMVAFDGSKKHIRKECNDNCSDSEDDDDDEDDEDYSLMRVSELRRKLDAQGLDVDGSREAMIEALDNSTGSVSCVNDLSAEE